MTFEEWLGDRIETMTSHEYASEKAAWDYQQERIDELEADMEKLRFDLGTKNLTAFAEGTRACCPEGYVVVPIEPTEAMVEAGDALWAHHCTSIYEAMIQAAQEEE